MAKPSKNEIHGLYPPGSKIPGEELLRDIQRVQDACWLDLMIYGTASYRIGNGTIHHLSVKEIIT